MMFKLLGKIVLICSLLGAQGQAINAGGVPDQRDFGAAVIVFGLGCTSVGAVGGIGAYKMYQWARYQQGTKQKIGKVVLAGLGIGALLGITYCAARNNK